MGLIGEGSHVSCEVAVVVVGYNSRRWLPECLGSLMAATKPDRDMVVFVDNGSQDGSAAWVAANHPRVRVEKNKRNLGFAVASNQGLRSGLAAGARMLFLLNPDTRTPQDLIEGLLDFLDSHPDYGVVGPFQAEYRSCAAGCTAPSIPNSWTKHALENGLRHAFHHWDSSLPPVTSARPTNGTFEHAYVQGAALAVRADVLRAIGFLDERYGSFYEEVDLCRRARWAGYRVALLRELWVEHAEGSVGAPSPYRAFHMTRNRYLHLFTDPEIGLRKTLRLSMAWVHDDLCRQLPAPSGLVTSRLQYVRIWGSLIRMAPHILTRRNANRRLSELQLGVVQ